MIDGFDVHPFEYAGARRDVYSRGDGPGVVVMSEIPGITPKVAEFAARVADRGYRVWMPDLFGEPGRPPTALYALGSMARACVSREFTVFLTRRRSPITEWLRALARAMHAERPDDPGVGAIGMCLTGNFALALMLDPCMQAPVLSQPSLPFRLSPRHARALHLGPGELEQIRDRSERDGVPVLGLRFTGDFLCPGARFEHLREVFGERFEGIEIDSRRGNPHGNPRHAHSVLTEHLIDREGHPTRAALERVLTFFDERLRHGDGADAGAI